MKGFKTIFAGISVVAISLLEKFNIADIVPDQYDDLAMAGVGFLMIALRMVTTSPVGKPD